MQDNNDHIDNVVKEELFKPNVAFDISNGWNKLKSKQRRNNIKLITTCAAIFIGIFFCTTLLTLSLRKPFENSTSLTEKRQKLKELEEKLSQPPFVIKKMDEEGVFIINLATDEKRYKTRTDFF